MSSDPARGLIDYDHFEQWQKTLIYEKKYTWSSQKDAERNQRDLELAVEASPTQVRDYLFRKLGITVPSQAERVVPSLPNPLTTGEMQKLPIHAEREVANALSGVTRAQAADSAFWTLCHAVWIGRWMFDADVAQIFMTGGRDSTPEQRTRNFLRRTGGLRRVRGNVSVLNDCQISRAWWRYQTAQMASTTAIGSGTTLSVDEAHQALQRSVVWEYLAGWSVKRATSLNAPRAQAAVIWVLARQDPEENTTTPKQQVQAVMRAVTRAGHNHSLSSMNWERLVEIAVEGLAQAQAVAVIDEDGDDDESE